MWSKEVSQIIFKLNSKILIASFGNSHLIEWRLGLEIHRMKPPAMFEFEDIRNLIGRASILTLFLLLIKFGKELDLIIF